jgi:hypothetical protein
MAETGAALEALTDSLSAEQVEEWKKQEQRALAQRDDALKVYEVQQDKGPQVSPSSSSTWDADSLGSTLSGRNKIEAN